MKRGAKRRNENEISQGLHPLDIDSHPYDRHGYLACPRRNQRGFPLGRPHMDTTYRDHPGLHDCHLLHAVRKPEQVHQEAHARPLRCRTLCCRGRRKRVCPVILVPFRKPSDSGNGSRRLRASRQRPDPGLLRGTRERTHDGIGRHVQQRWWNDRTLLRWRIGYRELAPHLSHLPDGRAGSYPLPARAARTATSENSPARERQDACRSVFTRGG
jgi:hypothetical protein